MQEKQILGQVVDTLIDTPDIFTLTVQPRNKWHALLIKYKLKPAVKEIKMYGLTPGNVYRISKALLDIPSDIISLQDRSTKDMLTLLVNHLDTVIYVVAVAFQNNRAEPSKKLLDWLKNGEEITDQQLRAIAIHVVKKLDHTGFTNTIVLVRGADILNQASPMENAEIIARSASLEAV